MGHKSFRQPHKQTHTYAMKFSAIAGLCAFGAVDAFNLPFDLSSKLPASKAKAAAKPSLPARAPAIPVLPYPETLDGSYLGDVGFDPLGAFGWDPLKLGWDKDFYREAEIKHGRLAMLAAVGYPIAEFLEPLYAKILGLPDQLLETGGRSVSLVNGGLEQGQDVLFLAVWLAAGAVVEKIGFDLKAAQGSDYTLGDVGFDPLNQYGKTLEERKNRRLQELKNGRLAMVAILLYVIEESVFKTSILRETPAIINEITNLKAFEADIGNSVAAFEKTVNSGIDPQTTLFSLETSLGKEAQLIERAADVAEKVVDKDLALFDPARY